MPVGPPTGMKTRDIKSRQCCSDLAQYESGNGNALLGERVSHESEVFRQSRSNYHRRGSLYHYRFSEH